MYSVSEGGGGEGVYVLTASLALRSCSSLWSWPMTASLAARAVSVDCCSHKHTDKRKNFTTALRGTHIHNFFSISLKKTQREMSLPERWLVSVAAAP